MTVLKIRGNKPGHCFFPGKDIPRFKIYNMVVTSHMWLYKFKLQLNKIDYEEKEFNKRQEEILILTEEENSLKDRISILENKNRYFEKTKEILEIAYEKMKNNVTPKFTKNLSNLISKISNGKYKKVNFNDEKGLIVELQNGEYVSANLLSVGTIDQLYLSLRLAMLEEISNEKMPIILDESFAYFDDERLKNILLFLLEVSKEHQVILLTCTKREKEILDELKIEYKYIQI